MIGGASGIGEAISTRSATEGISAFLTGRRKLEVDGAVVRIGNDARSIVTDAKDPASVDRAVADVVAAHGRIDALIFNAAIAEPADVLSSTAEHLDRYFTLNMLGPLLAMRAAIPHRLPSSAAVVVGSTASEIANSPYGTYAATKQATVSGRIKRVRCPT